MLDLSRARRSPALATSDRVRLLPGAGRYILRGGPQVMRAAGDAIGLAISDAACRSVRNEVGQAALWLGPDEQLLLCAAGEAPEIGRVLEAKLAGMPCSLVDVSHRQIALEVRGRHAQPLLNVGCPLDLDPATFPAGMCTRTVLGKAEIVLWRTEADAFRLDVGRSFADYVSRFLAEAARELGG